MFCFATIALRAMVICMRCAQYVPHARPRAGGSRAIARSCARTLRGLQVHNANRVPRVGRTNTTPKCKKCFSPKLVAHNGDYVQFRCAKFNIIDPTLCAFYIFLHPAVPRGEKWAFLGHHRNVTDNKNKNEIKNKYKRHTGAHNNK